jgi:hypothetical protein
MKKYNIDGFEFTTHLSDDKTFDLKEEEWTWKQWAGAIILTPIVLAFLWVMLSVYLIAF